VCECVHLITRGHFRSRDKDSGNTIRSAVDEDPMIHANLMALCVIGPNLWPIYVLHCGNRDFRFFYFCDLDVDLDPMTFIYELDSYSMKLYRMCKYELPTSRLLKGQTYRQTRPKLYTMPLRGWSDITKVRMRRNTFEDWRNLRTFEALNIHSITIMIRKTSRQMATAD